ncbi:hypothetical protein EV145_112133 [Flavobacterium sp. 245]|nr:hypothetical protein EV145_112133 [Flavobacterium sp. 245]
MRALLIGFLLISLLSCKTHIVTKYKIVTKERSYYTDEITYSNDSIKFYEKKRNGSLRGVFIIPFRNSEIIPSNERVK